MKITPIPRRRALGTIAAAVGAVAAVAHGPWRGGGIEAAELASPPPRRRGAHPALTAGESTFELRLEEPVQAFVSGFFTEVSGLGSETTVVEHREGGQNTFVHKLPGRMKWEDIVLKRGILPALDLWRWRGIVEGGDVDAARRNGSIILYDQGLEPIARWHFERGWPAKVSGPAPGSEAADVITEQLTIVHDGLRRVALRRED